MVMGIERIRVARGGHQSQRLTAESYHRIGTAVVASFHIQELWPQQRVKIIGAMTKTQ
jgi:hypothetical protein